MITTKDYEAVSLIYSDEYELMYRGRRIHSLAGQSEEVLIIQWVNRYLFSEDCKQRQDVYAYISKDNSHLARLIAYDFQQGKYVFESFSCSLAQYNRFLDNGSPVWEQTWRDATKALLQLHNSYLNHGNLTPNSFFFKKDGQLKIVGIFPNFNDDFKYNLDAPRPEGRAFLELEFKKDVAALCNIFLSEPYRNLISQADQDDCAKLAKGELTLEEAAAKAEERFNKIAKIREEKDVQARRRAIEEKERMERQRHKGPGFVFTSLVCIMIVMGVIGIKYAIDKANSEKIPNIPTHNNPASITDLKHELQQESDKASRQNIGDDGLVHTPETLPGREIPAELTRPPVLAEEPEKLIFVGVATEIIGPKLDVFNKNKQEKMSFIMDADTKVVYADGSTKRQSEIRLHQEVEVEYELGRADEKAYAHVIRLQD